MSNKIQRHGGYVIITALLFFLAGTSAILAGLSGSILRETRIAQTEAQSKQSYFTSESGLEDAIYRMKSAKRIDALGSVSLGQSTATISIATLANGSKDVVSSADLATTERNTESVLDGGVLVDLGYAVQAGDGGIDLGSSAVTGDAYAAGSIRATGPSGITGEAIAAGKSSSSLDSDNSTPLPATQTLTFGNSWTTEDVAQSFTASGPESITDLKVYIKKTGSPANLPVMLVPDSAGKPGSVVIASGQISSSLVGLSYSWQDISFSADPVLIPGQTYWLVFDSSANPFAYYIFAANFDYSPGNARIGQWGGVWNITSPQDLDIYFKLSIGKNEAGITGESRTQNLSAGSAYAYTISYVTAAGPIYCQIGVLNSSACDTSRADPALQDYPISNDDISAWKTEALAGGSETGDVSIDSTGGALGPKKIVGNLTVSDGGHLDISGPLWVTGSVAVNAGASVSSIDPSRSFVIVADGGAIVSGGATIEGNTGSHIMLVSTSSTDPAITVNGGANDVILFAPQGGVAVSGGASTKAVVAKHVQVSGGANVTYDPDLSSLKFSSGAPGGSAIKSWAEVL